MTFFSLITHFVPPALSLHIRLPSSHLDMRDSHPSVSISLYLLCRLLFPAQTHTHTPSFPTLNLLHLCVLNCPFYPSLLVIHPTFLSPFNVHFIQTHLSILFQVTPLSLTTLFYLFLLFLIGLLVFPKWIFGLTIQHLE